MERKDYEELSAERPLTEQEALGFLLLDGGRVPCSRYGWDSASCAPVAVAATIIVDLLTDAQGLSTDNLEHMMGLVVNDHDDPEYIIREYGAEFGYKWEDFEQCGI